MPITTPAQDFASDEVIKAALADIQFLCEQRLSAVRSSELTEGELRDFERRLPAYFDAILTRGPGVIDGLLALLPSLESSAEICGVVVVLLESRDPRGAAGIIAALEKAQEPPKLRGFQMALRRGPIDLLLPPLQKWLLVSDTRLAAIAAEALAYHRRISPKLPELIKLLSASDPLVRQAAWRAFALAQ
jgi:hypothetical protein